MKYVASLALVLALWLSHSSVHAGGYCQPQYNHYGYKQPYYAPYKAPVYHAPAYPFYYPVPVPYVAPVAPQGKTLYGISEYVNKPLDLTLAYERAARLAATAQELGGSATADVTAILDSEGGRQSRVAEIDAKARLLAAADPGDGESRSRLRVKVSSSARHGDELEDDAGADTSDIATVLKSRCLSCHSGSKPKGELNLSKFVSFSAADKAVVLERLTTKDAALRMPPNAELSVDELKAFFCVK